MRPGLKPVSTKIKEEQIEPFCMDKFLKQQNEKIIKSNLKDKPQRKSFGHFMVGKAFTKA